MTRRPSELELAIDGSVLRRPLARWLAIAAMAVVLVLALLQLLPLGEYGRPVAGVVAAALGIGAVICTVPVLVIRFLDRREPEPWFMVLIAVLWGGVVAAGLSAFVGQQLAGASASGPGPLFVEPVVAETAKALALLAILALLRDEFNGVRDGFVYGALIGVGATWFSAAAAIGDAYARTGDPNWAFQLLTNYPLLGLTGHTLFGALLGISVGIGMAQHDRLRAALWIGCGYLAAVAAHVMWAWASPSLIQTAAGWLGVPVSDRSSALVELATQPPWLGWLAVLFATVVTALPFSVLLLIALRWSSLHEHRMLLDRLADEDDDIITPLERDRLERSASPPWGRAGRIAQLQNELATRKDWLALRARDIEGDRHVSAYRDELRELR